MKKKQQKQKTVSGSSVSPESAIPAGSGQRKLPDTAAARQRRRAAKIKAAGLIKGSVIYHPEDRYEIVEYAKRLRKKRGIDFD